MSIAVKEVNCDTKVHINNAPYLRGQIIPNVCPVQSEIDYMLFGDDWDKRKEVYASNLKAERYIKPIAEGLLAKGYEYLVSVIDTLDIESYRECGATILYLSKGIIAYMPIKGVGWRESARLFFYENYVNEPEYVIEDNVTQQIPIPGKRKKLEIVTNGNVCKNRQSSLYAIHTFPVERLEEVVW